MNFSQAKNEFAVRYYLWGEAEFKREIDESFPILRSFKTGRFWKRYRFMERLDKRDQLILASGLLKRSNPDAVQIIGEKFTPDEERLLAQLREFRLNSPDLETDLHAKQQAGEKIKFAGKAKLRRVIIGRFKEAFGSNCIDLAIVGLDPDLNFKMQCCGWRLNTHFEFNGAARQITYFHQISSETAKEPDGVRAIILGFPSLCGWLGLRGDVEWGYLKENDIQPVCDFVIQRCRHFFEVVPKLLKGIEFEMITSE
jgi:hypothetical protein